jgi:hypothetical protein
MTLELQGVSSHVGSIKTIRNGVSVFSEEASAWRTALSISSCSYSGLAMHVFVHRYRKESNIAPHLSFSRKSEQYVIPSVIEQYRGMPKSSVVVRKVFSSAIRRVGRIA